MHRLALDLSDADHALLLDILLRGADAVANDPSNPPRRRHRATKLAATIGASFTRAEGAAPARPPRPPLSERPIDRWWTVFGWLLDERPPGMEYITEGREVVRVETSYPELQRLMAETDLFWRATPGKVFAGLAAQALREHGWSSTFTRRPQRRGHREYRYALSRD